MSQEKKEKKKCPTPLKRLKQSRRLNAHNRSFKARVRTAIRSFQEAVASQQGDRASVALCSVYSLMDKGVKTGIFKLNKAARVKSRLSGLQQGV